MIVYRKRTSYNVAVIPGISCSKLEHSASSTISPIGAVVVVVPSIVVIRAVVVVGVLI